MKLNLAGLNRQTKIFWFGMLSSAIIAFGVSISQSLNFSVQHFITLAVAGIIAAIVNQHQFTVPGTQSKMTVGELAAFWGILWLGIPGGIFLAIIASSAALVSSRKNSEKQIFDIFQNAAATLAAGFTFYFVLRQFGEFSETKVAENPVALSALLAAIGLMVLVHYVSAILITSVYISLQENYLSFGNYKKVALWKGLNYVIALVAAAILHFSFLKFDLKLGWILLPIAVAGHFAYKIHLSRLEQKTKEVLEASRVHLATVEALATAIDARDQVGIGHVRRTQIYAIGIGEVLGLSEKELSALETGALLHDIGKLAVPDHILNKPGRLTPAEMEKMKIHASVGASILEKVGFNYPVVPTVKHHHEMWDGTGYPEGLKGENIPLTSRILAVADVFDSLRGARPFRPAVSRDDARKQLLHGAGTQFDPKIVDVFLRNMRKFEDRIESKDLAYSFNNENGNLYTGDQTQQQGFVQQIKSANREVFTLYELAKVFSASLSLEDTLSLFVKKIGELIPFNSCAVYLMNEDGSSAQTAYAKGKNSTVLMNKRVKAGEGVTGYVLKKREAVYDYSPGLDFSGGQQKLAEDYTAMISLPLIAGDKLLGAVSLYSCELESYGEEHLRLLEAVSRIASDTISKAQQHAATETIAMTDPMTALPNARSLHLHFEKEIGRANRKASVFQVLMLDLDGFKAVNDTFGHKFGDDMLRGIAGVLLGQLRDYDFLARYAGDEFVAIIPETTGEAVRELCFRMEKAVAEFSLPVGDGRFAKVGVSIGASSYPHNGTSLEDLLIAADKMMYSVKAERKENGQKHQLPSLNNNDNQGTPDSVKTEMTENNFVVELDESHIISTAIN